MTWIKNRRQRACAGLGRPCYNGAVMDIRRFLVILLLLLLPVQVTLAAADSCCLAGKVSQAGSQAAETGAPDTPDVRDIDASCCTDCDFCHHSHAPFVAALAEGQRQPLSVAPVATPEPSIHSFIPDLPPRPNWLQ